MSTNYYLDPSTPTGVELDFPDDPGVHLGKWSNGWGFLARAHPGLSDTAERWGALLLTGTIRTEAGTEVTPQQLLELVRAGRRAQRTHQMFEGQYEDGGMRFDPHEFC